MDGAQESAYQQINVNKTVALAKKAKASGVKQFVFMSSIKVYGEESAAPYDEESVCHPKDPYGKSKLDAETALLAMADEIFKVAIIRTPVVYGEGVKANILKLIELTDKHKFLPFGGIHNRRSMIYIGNLIHLISEIIRQKETGIFLASDDSPISTSDLIAKIANTLGKRPLLFPFLPLKIMLKWLKPQIYQRLYGDLYLDDSRSKARLNLKNPFTSDAGIEKMVYWYLESIK
jgi:UDP-glucose 4-epimerase